MQASGDVCTHDGVEESVERCALGKGECAARVVPIVREVVSVGAENAAVTSVDGTPGASELSWSTESRTSWRRVVSAGPNQAPRAFWTITLTVPKAAAGSASRALFDRLADGFTPPTP